MNYERETDRLHLTIFLEYLETSSMDYDRVVMSRNIICRSGISPIFQNTERNYCNYVHHCQKMQLCVYSLVYEEWL